MGRGVSKDSPAKKAKRSAHPLQQVVRLSGFGAESRPVLALLGMPLELGLASGLHHLIDQ